MEAETSAVAADEWVAQSGIGKPHPGIFAIQRLAGFDMWRLSAKRKWVGRYEIDREIDSFGGFPVYLASDIETGFKVGLEALPVSGADRSEIKQAREAARRKAEQTTRLRHERIARVYGVEKERGQLWVAHEVVRGETLENLLCTESAISKDLISHVLYHTAKCLNYAHQLGVGHGSLSPAELVFQDDGSLKIVGFWRTSLAASGEVPAFDITYYSSPEQIRGIPSGSTSDQYSLATIAYELLTGVTPFEGDAVALRDRIVFDPPTDPAGINSSLGKEASAVLLRALDKDPRARFVNCLEFVEALDDSLETPPLWVIPKEYSSQSSASSRKTTVDPLEGADTEPAPRDVVPERREVERPLFSSERPQAERPRLEPLNYAKPVALAAIALVVAWLALMWGTRSIADTAAANLVVAAVSPPPAVVNQPYSFQLQANGGSSPYEWTVVEGQLPEGMGLDPEGVLRGQPDVTGVFDVHVQVKELGSAATATQPISLTVRQGPRIKSASTLAPVVVGREITYPLGVEGGQRPYRWAIADGSIPPGVSLNSFSGFLDGRPEAPGIYRFSVSVSDLFGVTSTRPFELTVRPAADDGSVETIVQAGVGARLHSGGSIAESAGDSSVDLASRNN